MITFLEGLSQSWGIWVLQGILPSVILAAGLFLVEWMPWRPPARWRMALWAIVLLRAIWPAALTVSPGIIPSLPAEWVRPVPRGEGPMPPMQVVNPSPEARPGTVATATDVPRSAAHPRSGATVSWQAWVFLAWGGGIAGWWVLRLLRSHRLRRSLGLRPPPARHQEELRDWLEAAGLPPSAVRRIRISARTSSPLVLGLARPTIVLPEGLLSSPGLCPIVIHETLHVRWRDPLVFALADLLKLVHLPNPAMWLAARRLRDLAEEACDDESSRRIGDPHAYARALVGVSLQVARGRALVGFAEAVGRSHLARRVERILSRSRHRSRWAGRCLAITWLGLAFLSLPASGTSEVDLPDDDRAIRIELPGGGHVAADGITVNPEGVSELRADPGREITARVPLNWKDREDTRFALVRARGVSVTPGTGDRLTVQVTGPARLTLDDPPMSALAESVTYEMPLHGRVPGSAASPKAPASPVLRARTVEFRLGHTGKGAQDETSLRAAAISISRSVSRESPQGQWTLCLEGDVRVEAPGLFLACERAVFSDDGTLSCERLRNRMPLEGGAPVRMPFVRRIVIEGSAEILLEDPDDEGGER